MKKIDLKLEKVKEIEKTLNILDKQIKETGVQPPPPQEAS